ncbi:MAG: Flp/Fap pilin component [Chloroflexi bacterium]|nr:Flp/Fap pilin component [Chloroflexota bacterium]
MLRNLVQGSKGAASEARTLGQGMVEYGLIMTLVAVVAIAGLVILGPKIAEMFTSLGSSV